MDGPSGKELWMVGMEIRAAGAEVVEVKKDGLVAQ